MLELIDSLLLERRGELAQRFRSAVPFPHLVIDRFFDPSFCEKLIEEFPPFDGGCNLNEDRQPGLKATYEDLRSLGKHFADADDLFRSREFAGLVSDITGIPNLLYDPDYIGGGTHENLAGQDLDPHVDFNYHPSRGWHRRLNLIVYLNPEWEERWGGSLELHEDPWPTAARNQVSHVVPVANRAVVFETSERSWHGFQQIRPPVHKPDLSRKSLAIYMYTVTRPDEETASPHSTVYVERPIPFVLKPGRPAAQAQIDRLIGMLTRRRQHIDRLQKRELEFVERQISLVRERLSMGDPLRQSDIDALGRAFRREDDLLRALYDREKDFARDFAALDTSIRERPPGGLIVSGPATLAGEPSGYDPVDHWAESKLGFTLVANGMVERITLYGALPDILPPEQVLSCTVRERTHSIQISGGPFEWTFDVSLAPGEQIDILLHASVWLLPARDIPNSTDPRELSYQLFAVETS